MSFRNIKDNSRRYHAGGGPRPDRNVTKRFESEQRAELWRALSPKEQIRRLAHRPGNSSRQVARISE